MANVKHVGRIKSNKAKVVIVYRMIPNDPYNALVVGTSALSEVYHNSLMTVVESQQGQDAFELGELNVMIAEQKGITVDELAKPREEARDLAKVNEVAATPATPATPARNPNDPLSDTDLAKSYRSQADAMYKEAARLRKQADELDPPKKKTAKVSEDASA